MTAALHFIGLLFIIGAIGSCSMAKTPIHEIAGLISLLVGIALIGVGLLFDKLASIGKVLIEIRDRLPRDPPPSLEPGKFVCGKCRNEIPEGARVCPSCGTKLGLPAQPA